MSDDAKEAWGRVGEKFSSWGRRVSDRYGAAGSSAAPSNEDMKELQRAAKEVIDEVTRGVTAFGHTLKDDEANKELGQAVNAIGDAITATVKDVTDSISKGASDKDVPPRPEDSNQAE
jgi:hypothetical protein